MPQTVRSGRDVQTAPDIVTMKNRVRKLKYLPEPEMPEPPRDGQFLLAVWASIPGILAIATALLMTLLFIGGRSGAPYHLRATVSALVV